MLNPMQVSVCKPVDWITFLTERIMLFIKLSGFCSSHWVWRFWAGKSPEPIQSTVPGTLRTTDLQLPVPKSTPITKGSFSLFVFISYSYIIKLLTSIYNSCMIILEWCSTMGG
jgi:hypothetical protein